MSMQNNISDQAGDDVAKAKAAALSSLDDLKSQAAQAAEQARGTLSNIASDARSKINDIVDTQKSAGADHLAGLARAAQSAAGDLDEKSPQVARLVRDAASSVDRFAGDLRNRDVREVLDQVTSFARQQPVAFFAGSVLVGFVLARFLKSDAPVSSFESSHTAVTPHEGARRFDTPAATSVRSAAPSYDSPFPRSGTGSI